MNGSVPLGSEVGVVVELTIGSSHKAGHPFMSIMARVLEPICHLCHPLFLCEPIVCLGQPGLCSTGSIHITDPLAPLAPLDRIGRGSRGCRFVRRAQTKL